MGVSVTIVLVTVYQMCSDPDTPTEQLRIWSDNVRWCCWNGCFCYYCSGHCLSDVF